MLHNLIPCLSDFNAKLKWYITGHFKNELDNQVSCLKFQILIGGDTTSCIRLIPLIKFQASYMIFCHIFLTTF